MTGQAPMQTLFAYALLRDEHGEEMHKSKGNASGSTRRPTRWAPT